ncbi:tail fiber assembly protein [Edwardsiella piscicida]
MIHLKNLKPYMPDDPVKKELCESINAIFYRSDDGNDWYEAIPLFKSDAYKIKYNQSGVICSINQDASAICPEDGSVVEVKTLPDGCDISGAWVFANGKITRRIPGKEELISLAEQKKQDLLQFASQKIAPLQDAVDLDMATPVERESLMTWKKYRVEVNRVDVSAASWPVQPE